jgi:hypothetical protein
MMIYPAEAQILQDRKEIRAFKLDNPGQFNFDGRVNEGF